MNEPTRAIDHPTRDGLVVSSIPPRRHAAPYTIRGVKGSSNTITPFAWTQLVVQAEDGAIQEVRRWDNEGYPVGDDLTEDDLQDLQRCEEFTPLDGEELQAVAPMGAWLVGCTADPRVVKALCSKARCRTFKMAVGAVLLLEDAREAEKGREAAADRALAWAVKAARGGRWGDAQPLAMNAWYLGNPLNAERLAALVYCTERFLRTGASETSARNQAEWYLRVAERSYGVSFARQVSHRLEQHRAAQGLGKAAKRKQRS